MMLIAFWMGCSSLVVGPFTVAAQSLFFAYSVWWLCWVMASRYACNKTFLFRFTRRWNKLLWWRQSFEKWENSFGVPVDDHHHVDFLDHIRVPCNYRVPLSVWRDCSGFRVCRLVTSWSSETTNGNMHVIGSHLYASYAWRFLIMLDPCTSFSSTSWLKSILSPSFFCRPTSSRRRDRSTRRSERRSLPTHSPRRKWGI